MSTVHRRAFLNGVLLAPFVSMAVASCGSSAVGAKPVEKRPTGEFAAFDNYLKQLTAEGKFSGAVLVAKNGAPLLEAGYGMADKKTGRSNTTETLFCVGSMGKMFTAVGVGQLVEQGKLSFDDPIGKYLTGFPPEVATTVKVHHLLTHTAGMGDIFGTEPVTEANHTIDALMTRIRTAPLQFAPGTRFSYSNAGFVTLGALIERVSGQRYGEYITERVFRPAGMSHTAVRSYRPRDVSGMAHPYALYGPDGQPVPLQPGPAERQPGTELRDVSDEVKGGSPAGGAISTLGDMLGFAEALIRNRLLSPNSTATMLAGRVAATGTARTPPNRPASGSPANQPPPAAAGASGERRPALGTTPSEPPMYGYGFFNQRSNGVRIVGHNGATAGYQADLAICPDTRHVAVIFTNQDQAIAPVQQRSEELLTT